MRRIETYELIERYLLGRTSPDENTEIEQRIKNDPSFAIEVEQHRGMQQVIHDHSILDVKEILTRIRNQKQISAKRRNRFYRSMLIVGSCAIILSLSVLFILNNDDGAVRRASEAPGASEAFTDSLAPANGSDAVAAEAESLEKPLNKNDRLQTGKALSPPDGKSGSVQDDAGTDLQEDQETKPVPQIRPLHDTAASAGALSDLQSADDTVTSELSSADLNGTSQPCKFKAEYSKEASCNNKATGTISIMVQGDTPPYQAILNGDYSDSLVFRGLKPGFYKLEIKDASGCLVSLGTIIIETKDCRYEGNFYPLLEVWEIPLDSQPGTIEILNKNGLTVYRQRFDGTGREYWNGNDLKNEALPMGVYFFTIRYDSGDVFQGSVTINR